MKIIAHTMEYRGRSIVSPLRLRNYSAFDYEEYKRIYEECFRDMRTALQRFPVDCCDSKEELEHKKDKIYILEIDGKLVGSVSKTISLQRQIFQVICTSPRPTRILSISASTTVSLSSMSILSQSFIYPLMVSMFRFPYISADI